MTPELVPGTSGLSLPASGWLPSAQSLTLRAGERLEGIRGLEFRYAIQILARGVDPPVVTGKSQAVPPLTDPIVDATKLPPGALPADPTGGHIGDRARRPQDAALLPKLGAQPSGLDTTRGAGPGDDSVIGHAIVPGDGRDELCKRASFRRLVRGLGICAGGDAGGLSPDSQIGDGFETKNPVPSATESGGAFALGGPTAGGRVPSRGGQASDDDVGNDGGPKPDHVWTDRDGRDHTVTIEKWKYWTFEELTGHPAPTAVTVHEVVRNSDGRPAYERTTTSIRVLPDAAGCSFAVVTTTRSGTGEPSIVQQRCNSSGGDCITVLDIRQPDERGRQRRALPWFCARNPKDVNCQTKGPGSQIDPANPDGEGTPSGRPRAETPRLGREAVIDPAPADSEIRGVTGGGSSGPLDIKDPIPPGPPN